ncbi:C69 family dipeptidase, partial [Pseudomonas aeruginosa]|uniref:C69 family dipeptidase n=1 Tax=Pseudomonas aeruginosa TaxID=287 RepID=UPI001FC8FE80
RLLRRPAVRNDPEARLRTTYLDIPQTAQRHALVISQPSWIWGAEMGVNEHGVAIGNEAVFTKLTRQRGTALLGMDLLRLGLERGASAREALEVITGLLQRYGQGGPAGYRDKRIRYDNSFLIADPGEAWVLETAGNLWAAKKVERWAISNALTLGHEFDLCSRDLEDQARRQGCWDGRGDFHFARVFDTRLLPWVGGAHRRCRVNQRFLDSLPGEPDWHALFAALRHHGPRGDHFRRHNNRQVCMHAGSFWRPSQTTASLVARLRDDGPLLAATGTSAPCLGLFQPLSFDPASGTAVLSQPREAVQESPWWRFEAVHRRALTDRAFRRLLRSGRDWLERELFADLEQPDWPRLAEDAAAWHACWHDQVAMQPLAQQRWWRSHAAR